MSNGHIGVDESGKGDYFGPLVIAACFVGPEHIANLDGVCDSKKLTDAAATRLAQTIKETCPHSIIAIGPARYNEMYVKTPNLNRLLAWGHAQCVQNVLELRSSEKVISDQFADPTYLKSLLQKKGMTSIELISVPRAESDIAVAAASILARAEFLRRLKKLGEEFGVELPKGATNVIGPAKRLVADKGRDVLGQVAKLHFKTTQQVLAGF